MSARRVWSDLSADEQERVTRLLRPDPDDNLDDLLARCKRAQEIIRGEPSRAENGQTVTEEQR